MTGKELREIQERKEMTIEELAEKMECSERTVRRYFDREEVPTKKAERLLKNLEEKGEAKGKNRGMDETVKYCPFRKKVWKYKEGGQEERFLPCIESCMAYEEGMCRMFRHVKRFMRQEENQRENEYSYRR